MHTFALWVVTYVHISFWTSFCALAESGAAAVSFILGTPPRTMIVMRRRANPTPTYYNDTHVARRRCGNVHAWRERVHALADTHDT